MKKLLCSYVLLTLLIIFSACQKELNEPQIELNEPKIEDYIDQIIGTYQGKYTYTYSAPPNINTYNEENNVIITVEKSNNSNERIHCFRTGHNFSKEYILESLELPVTYSIENQIQLNKGSTKFYLDESRLELSAGSSSPGGGWGITFSGIKLN